jgi:leukotriene-A4 hydrolase
MSENFSNVPDFNSVLPDTKVKLNESQCHELVQNIIAAEVDENPRQCVIPVESKDIVVIDNVIDIDKCRELCEKIDICPHLTFWSHLGRLNSDAVKFRNADTIELVSKDLSKFLWNRISEFIENWEINIDSADDPLWERQLPGRWVADAVNHDFLLAKYPSGGHFAPHTDGRVVHDFNRRSFYSIILFLNDIPAEMGGGTRFYCENALNHLKEQSDSNGNTYWTCDSSFITDEIEAKAGRMLIFDQRCVHEGIRTKVPHCKYIVRSDIIFKRTPPLCDTDTDKTAFALYCEGENQAEKGNIPSSIQLFRKAIKLSPNLAEYLGL